jgi:GTP-binding protein
VSLARIAIVGRPNVGKSTLLNRMVGSRVSIVEPTAGVTRDRVSVRTRIPSPFGERAVEVIDTGGIGIVDRDDLGALVEEQVRAAVEVADLVLFLVDARDGLTPLDLEVAERLRALAKPVILVANKVESERVEAEVGSFWQLGVGGDPLPISAQNGNGVGELYERIADLLPPHDVVEEEEARPAFKLAVVGRRNAGKSTLVNKIARQERVIVSEIPGTTRDALDIVVERDGESFVLIDTAGVRRRKSHADAVEFYSDARAYKAIRRSDVVILLFDATTPLSAIEKKLARYVRDHYKTVILGANKWDLVQGLAPDDFQAYLMQELPGLAHVPVSFLSAKTGQNVARTLELARELHEQASTRVATGELNRVLQRALSGRSPSSRGHRVRILYATQTDVSPPTFVLFVNDKRLIGKDYLRYLENRMRDELPFAEVPIQIVLRDKTAASVPESP